MKKHKTILLPLGRQFSIILVLFIVCTAGITLYNTQDYVRVQTDFLSSSLDSYSSQLAKNTQEAYDSYENICYSAAYSSVVQDFLSSKNRQSSYEAYQDIFLILQFTDRMVPLPPLEDLLSATSPLPISLRKPRFPTAPLAPP